MNRILAAIGSALLFLAALIALSGRTQVDPWAEPYGDWPYTPNGRR